MFFTVFWYLEGGDGAPKGGWGSLLMQFSTLYSSKSEISETGFFDILIIHNDQLSYAKHVLGPVYVFFTRFGCLEGARGLGPNLLMQFYTLYSSKK